MFSCYLNITFASGYGQINLTLTLACDKVVLGYKMYFVSVFEGNVGNMILDGCLVVESICRQQISY